MKLWKTVDYFSQTKIKNRKNMCFKKIVRIFFKQKMTEKSDDEVQKGRYSLKMQANCLAKINNASGFYDLFLITNYPFFKNKFMSKIQFPQDFSESSALLLSL